MPEPEAPGPTKGQRTAGNSAGPQKDTLMAKIMEAPNGERIIGTWERVYGVAIFARAHTRQELMEGDYDHSGETDIDWDTQETVGTEDGRTQFVAADGNLYTLDQLVEVEAADDPADEPETIMFLATITFTSGEVRDVFIEATDQLEAKEILTTSISEDLGTFAIDRMAIVPEKEGTPRLCRGVLSTSLPTKV